MYGHHCSWYVTFRIAVVFRRFYSIFVFVKIRLNDLQIVAKCSWDYWYFVISSHHFYFTNVWSGHNGGHEELLRTRMTRIQTVTESFDTYSLMFKHIKLGYDLFNHPYVNIAFRQQNLCDRNHHLRDPDDTHLSFLQMLVVSLITKCAAMVLWY